MTFLRSHRWCIVQIFPKRPQPQTLSYTLRRIILPALCIILTKNTGTCLFPEPVCLPQQPDNFFVFGNSSDVLHCLQSRVLPPHTHTHSHPILLFAVTVAAPPAVQGALCEACCPVCLLVAWQPFIAGSSKVAFFISQSWVSLSR